MTVTASRWHVRESTLLLFVRNVTSRYALVALNALIGVVLLPFNYSHLGQNDYGLWVLVASVTAYFSVLELGYGGAVVKFVAEHRARRDARALNETLSTMFFVFSAMGVLAYFMAIGISFLLPYIFNLDAQQARTGQIVLLLIAVNVSCHFVFSVFGGVINGFERNYINNVVGVTFNVLQAVANVVVLSLGYGLVELVATTTALRLIPYWIYRRNAYRVFPELRIGLAYFKRARLVDLTGFSVYLAVIDWSSRLLFVADVFLLGILMTPAAVAVYAVAQKLSDALVRMTHQLHGFLFPAVVARAVDGESSSQRQLMVKATRFQLAAAVCMCGAVAAVGDVLIRAWMGPTFTAHAQSAVALYVLCAVVVVRSWTGMPGTVLKGTGHHRDLAIACSVAGVANVLLSVVAVKLFGMVGVAVAMLVSSVLLAAFFIFPRACRVVGLPMGRGYREIVWPAVWPAFFVMGALLLTRHLVPAQIVAVLAQLAVAGVVYLAIFFTVALPRDERRWMSSALNQVWRRSLATV